MTGSRTSFFARFVGLGALGACVLGTGACGSTSSSPTSPTSSTQATATLQYVSVTGNFLIGAVGGSTQLRANANTTSGSQDVTSQSTWQSSNDAVATVSSGGLVSAKAAGLVVITAIYQGSSGPAGISIATPVNVSGTWTGSSVNPTSDITWTLAQAGDSVSGNSTALGGGATYTGSVSGTVNGGTVIVGGTTADPSGNLYSRWTDERCALENANTLRCINPMTDARGNFTRMEVTFTRQ